jgi:hypothetical protein
VVYGEKFVGEPTPIQSAICNLYRQGALNFAGRARASGKGDKHQVLLTRGSKSKLSYQRYGWLVMGETVVQVIHLDR